MKFLDLQLLLKDKFGIDHLADIARELDVTPQAVSNWKARDHVPYKYVIMIRKQIEKLNNEDPLNIDNQKSDTEFTSPQTVNPIYFEEKTISLSDIILILAKNIKIIIIIPTILCSFIIIYTSLFKTELYQSSAKIMSSSGPPGPAQATGLAAQFGINLPNSQTQPQWVYPELVKSRTLARTMLERKFSTNRFGSNKSLLEILTYSDKSNNIDYNFLIKNAVNKFINMIEIQQSGSFYNLTITAIEPIFARDIAIALIDELDAHQREYNKSRTSKTRQFIEDRIINTRMELENAEEAFKNFRDSNRRIENSPTLQLEQQRLAREVSVLTGVFTTLKQQLETTKIEEVKVDEYVIILDSPEAPIFPISSGRKQKVLIAGFFGIALGIMIGFLREFLNDDEKIHQNKIVKAKKLIYYNLSSFIPTRLKKK